MTERLRDPASWKLRSNGDWWKAPDDLAALPRSYWQDPVAGGYGGVLSGDRIRLFCSLFGMLRPYQERHLKAASYALTMGDHAIVDGERCELTSEHSDIVIASGASATLVPAEALVVPHFLIARIGLSVRLVHEGLLMGAGPQVDPGYQGFLFCPVYNLAGGAVTIRRGRRVGRIDFVRTTGLAAENPQALAEITTEAELYEREQNLHGAGGHPVPLFEGDRRWRHPLNDY